MRYNIVSIGDLHWGAIKASDMLNQYQYFLDFLNRFPEKIDLVVNHGDSTDDKLGLGSKSSIYYTNTIHQQLKLGKEKGFKSRYVVGTKSHENIQYEVFSKLEDEDFRIMRYTTIEETLPGLNCLYCPDETIPTNEYMMNHAWEFTQRELDIMFFHGTCDRVNQKAVQQNEQQELNNVIYKYNYFSKICRLMIGSHWHDADHYKHMYYTRSYTRWAYDEDRDKGFIFVSYDTDTKKYFLERIPNPMAPIYKTYVCSTVLMKTIESYINFISTITEAMKNDPTMHIRVQFIIESDMDDTANAGLALIKDTFSREKNAKIDIKNLMKKKEASERFVKRQEEKKRFGFLEDRSIEFPEKVRRFILETKDVDIPLDYIDNLFKRIKDKRKEKE